MFYLESTAGTAIQLLHLMKKAGIVLISPTRTRKGGYQQKELTEKVQRAPFIIHPLKFVFLQKSAAFLILLDSRDHCLGRKSI